MVDLRTKGGSNRSWKVYSLLDPTVDELFVVTGDGIRYRIPVKLVMNMRMLSLGKRMKDYIV